MKTKHNKSFFIEQLGDTPKLRVLDFLIGNHFFDFPMTEIARESNVSYNSIVIFFGDFIKSGIILKTRKVGKSDYYKLNLENLFIKNLMRLDWSLVEKGVLGEDAPVKSAGPNQSIPACEIKLKIVRVITPKLLNKLFLFYQF